MGLEALPQFADWCYEQSLLWSQIEQARRVNRKRGSWRRPQLTGTVSRLEKALLSQWDFTEHAIVLLLAGEELPVVQQDAEQDRLITAALEHHGLSEEDAGRSVDRKKLAAILLVLASWRARQLSLVGETIEEVFAASRTAILKRLKRLDAEAQPGTEVLTAQLKTSFEADSQRLYRDLLDGSLRSTGVRAIVEESATLGAAVLALRNLFDIEQFRLNLFSEHATWWSFQAGFRAGAVDGTAAALAAGEEPMRFLWSGPQDAKACVPCLSAFSEGPILATSLSALPSPSSICQWGVSCRHFYVVV